MLDPNRRALYVDSLRPPPGRVFDQGIATTYSLGLDTLLTIPLQLALFDRRNSEDLLADGVAVLEALRRTSARLSVYCQQGQIHVPAADQLLYGMLEPIVHEVRAPGGGVFHAKVWVLRYVDPTAEQSPLLRVVVLSRNLTFDRSWDLSLLLEGSPRKGVQRSSSGLAKLIRRLPEIAAQSVPREARDRAVLLADQVSKTRFEPPLGFETVSFHTNGLGGHCWLPAKSSQLAVISPFCDAAALGKLAASSRRPITLISRPEALDALPAETLKLFSRTLVLEETAETEDGEDTGEGSSRLHGLHAKAFITKWGRSTRIALGSANATGPGLLNGRNVELVAELTGEASRVGRVKDLLGKDGFGDVLCDYVRPDEPPELDPAQREAERALEQARLALGQAGLVVCCEAGAEMGAWRMALRSKGAVTLGGIADLRAWPITLSEAHAADALDLGDEEMVDIGCCATASVTGLIAFDATACAADQRARFVLNLPLEGLPEERDAAVMRAIISNQDGFLRYLALLLADIGEDPFAHGRGGGEVDWKRLSAGAGLGDAPILEHLVRALCREPERLQQVRRLVERLHESEGGDDVIPPEFRTLWASFECVLGDEA